MRMEWMNIPKDVLCCALNFVGQNWTFQQAALQWKEQVQVEFKLALYTSGAVLEGKQDGY